MNDAPPTLIEGRDPFAQAARQIVALPRLQLRILSQDLDAAVYGASAFIDTLKSRLLGNRGLQVHVLLANSGAAFSKSQPLRELASRLPSRFQFRTPPDVETLKFADEALIADRIGYLHRSDDRSHTAKFAIRDVPGAHLLVSRFDQLWADAELAADFRDMPM